ncbi:MAG: RluA family pseudouridine synthase, partial [Clostridia bacterium]|nr:RluA family pseudouridine synthase [Clostridia bacterium]
YYKNSEDFVLRIINRLDKDTSGLMIIAKDSIAQKDIKNIKKTYFAICEGKIDQNLVINKKIDTIKNNGINERKRVITNNGKDAETYIYPIKTNGNLSLVKIELKHGRTHQIRIHLSSNNTPLLGDEIYGKRSKLISHTALICKCLSFFHPYLNKTLFFEVDFPNDIKQIIDLVK